MSHSRIAVACATDLLAPASLREFGRVATACGVARAWVASVLVGLGLSTACRDRCEPRRLEATTEHLPVQACADPIETLARAWHGRVVARKPAPFYRLYAAKSPSQAEQLTQEILGLGFRSSGHAPFPVADDVEWRANPYGDRSWQFVLNSTLWLQPLLDRLEQTDDSKLVDYALSVALDWQKDQPLGADDNEWSWYDMGAGIRAAHFAFVVDRALRTMSANDPRVEALYRLVHRHLTELQRHDAYPGDYNHGFYMMAGLLALARTFPELAASDDAKQLALERIDRYVGKSFSAAGTHLEHSPDYQLAMTNALVEFDRSGLYSAGELIPKARAVLSRMAHPDGKLAQLGDTTRRTLPSGFPEPEEGLFYDDEGGVAIWRDGDDYLYLQAGNHSRTHKHCDDLAIEWSTDGKRVLVDGGLFRYWHEDPRRMYIVSPRAHNTLAWDDVECDRVQYIEPRPRSFLKDHCEVEGWTVIRGERPYSVGTHRRLIAVRKGALLVHDRFESAGDALPVTVRWLFDVGWYPNASLSGVEMDSRRVGVGWETRDGAQIEWLRGADLMQPSEGALAPGTELLSTRVLRATATSTKLDLATAFLGDETVELAGESGALRLSARGENVTVAPDSEQCRSAIRVQPF